VDLGPKVVTRSTRLSTGATAAAAAEAPASPRPSSPPSAPPLRSHRRQHGATAHNIYYRDDDDDDDDDTLLVEDLAEDGTPSPQQQPPFDDDATVQGSVLDDATTTLPTAFSATATATATTVTADQRVRRQYESFVYPPVPREFMEPSQPPSQSSQSSPLAHRSYSILPRAKLLAAVRSMAAKETLPGLSAYDHYIHDGDLDRRWHYSPSTRPAPRRRILVAGGGTGTKTLELALDCEDRNLHAEIVHLDVSLASIAIARKLIQWAGLAHRVTFVAESIERYASDIAQRASGAANGAAANAVGSAANGAAANPPGVSGGSAPTPPPTSTPLFDLIWCTGVLHHLADPGAALTLLRDALTEDGAILLMVYGKHGRHGVYETQEALRYALPPDEDLDDEQRLSALRSFLGSEGSGGGHHVGHREGRIGQSRLPATSLLALNAELGGDDLVASSDAELFDRLLHSRDRSYSVPELYNLVEKEVAGLRVVSLFPEIGYQPDSVVFTTDAARASYMARRVRDRPLAERQHFAELMTSRPIWHKFFVVKQAMSDSANADNKESRVGGGVEGKEGGAVALAEAEAETTAAATGTVTATAAATATATTASAAWPPSRRTDREWRRSFTPIVFHDEQTDHILSASGGCSANVRRRKLLEAAGGQGGDRTMWMSIEPAGFALATMALPGLSCIFLSRALVASARLGSGSGSVGSTSSGAGGVGGGVIGGGSSVDDLIRYVHDAITTVRSGLDKQQQQQQQQQHQESEMVANKDVGAEANSPGRHLSGPLVATRHVLLPPPLAAEEVEEQCFKWLAALEEANYLTYRRISNIFTQP
jgi:SAM-dependent methyltransferase